MLSHCRESSQFLWQMTGYRRQAIWIIQIQSQGMRLWEVTLGLWSSLVLFEYPSAYCNWDFSGHRLLKWPPVPLCPVRPIRRLPTFSFIQSEQIISYNIQILRDKEKKRLRAPSDKKHLCIIFSAILVQQTFNV